MGQIIDPNSLLIKTDQQPATVPFFNNLIAQFCNAINGVGARMDGYDVAEENLVQLGLANINSVLGPFLGTLQEAAQLGFLVAQADGHSLSLTNGAPFDCIMTSVGAELFTPTKWLMALDVTDSTNWGILQLDSWVVQDLNLATHCIYASKTQTSSSWQVTCGSGVLNAMVNDLSAANTAAANAQSSASSAASAQAFCASVAGSISSGPVVSVAGKTGAVSLAESDIANLVSDLAARATTSYVTSVVAGLQPHSVTLDALAALTYSSFIIAFLGAANAAAALTTLGAAPLASPTFTGTPAAPTPTIGDNSTKLATTAFVQGSSPPIAVNSDVWTGTSNSKFLTPVALASASSPVAVAFASTITLDMSAGVNFNIGSITGNFTLANPLNAVAGYSGCILLPVNHANTILTKGTRWLFPGGVPVPSAGTGVVDAIFYYVASSTQILGSYVKAYT